MADASSELAQAHPPPRHIAGVTLIELTVSIMVIAIAVSGTLLLVSTATRHSADPMVERQALAIADAYLEEILLRAFYDPDLGVGGGSCPAAEASRPLFDNVCDYDGLDDSGARDQDGNAIAGLGAYRVRVNVDTTATLNTLSGASDVLRTDVRVTHPNQIDLSLSGYRARF
jgi:MSHA pilin protein MshD